MVVQRFALSPHSEKVMGLNLPMESVCSHGWLCLHEFPPDTSLQRSKDTQFKGKKTQKRLTDEIGVNVSMKGCLSLWLSLIDW